MAGVNPINRWKRLFTLFLLLSFCVIILSFQLKQDSHRGTLFGALSTVMVPVVSLIDLLIDNITDTFDEYYTLISVRSQNKQLKRQLWQLNKENNRLKEYMYENGRLRKLLDFRKEFGLKTAVAARVIGRDATHWFQSVLINVGSRNRVKRNMPVVNNDGVIGHLVEVGPYYSKVQLIIDKGSGISVLLQRSRDTGIMNGQGENLAKVKYLLNSSDVRKGDLLLSSGLGSIYPKGLPVGYISTVIKDKRDLFQKVYVRPVVDFSKLSEVLVVLKDPDNS
ncbi:MAG: rod shape-determining protein MreC [bacterium]